MYKPKHLAKPEHSSKLSSKPASSPERQHAAYVGRHVSSVEQPTSQDQMRPMSEEPEQESTETLLTTTESQQTPADQPSVARSTTLMAFATLGSRATGLIRTFVMANALGITIVASSYQVANNLPTIIYELVAGGLLSAAFVPLFLLQVKEFGKKGGDRYASNLLNIVIVVMGVIAIILTIFAEKAIFLQTFTVGSSSEVQGHAVIFFRIFAIQILFYGIGGVFTSILNANRVFFLPAIAPLFNNVMVITSFIIYPVLQASNPGLAISVIAVGTTLGVVAQFAIQIPAMVRLKFKYSPRINFKDPAFIETLKIGLPMIIYVAGTFASFTMRNAFSLQTGVNGPAILVYAWTWFQLPHGIIAASLSRALFTEMSLAIAQKDMKGFKRYLHQGISATMLIVIPLAGLMCVLAMPLMQIFRTGAFGAADVAYVGTILSMWVFAMPCYSLQLYLFNVYASLRRFGLFTGICTALCILQCSLYALLCSNPTIALAGVPIADFVYYLTSTIILLIVLRKLIGDINGRVLAFTTIKVLIATVVGAGLMGVVNHYLPFGSSMIAGVGAIILYGGVGLVVILALCRLMRVSEMALVSELLGKVTNRLRRK